MNKLTQIPQLPLKLIQWFLHASLIKKVLVIIVIGVVGWVGYKHFAQSKSNQPQYQFGQVTRGTVLTTVSESGNVASSSQVGIGSPTTGIVTAISVKDGQTVKQGQLLFKVASVATAQEKASALASYLSSKTALDNANATLFSLQSSMYSKWQTYTGIAENSTFQNGDGSPNTTNRVLPQFTTAQDDWLAAEANFKNQQNAIAQSQASLNTALLAYRATQDATVTAPIDGTVANLTVKVGDQITASGGNLSSNVSSTTSTNAILYIGDYQKPYVKVQAGEADVPNIQAGQKATISLDAFPDKTFVGSVDQVDTTGTISSGVVTYNVFVSFLAPLPNILPGMTATVTIQTARKDDTLYVPSTAVQTANNGLSTVRVMKNGQLTTVPVQTGLMSDTNTEITSGLSEGDMIVVSSTRSTSSAATTGTSPFARTFGGGGGGFVGGGGGGRGGG